MTRMLGRVHKQRQAKASSLLLLSMLCSSADTPLQRRVSPPSYSSGPICPTLSPPSWCGKKTGKTPLKGTTENHK